MPDDRSKRTSQDSDRVSTTEEHEIRYWSKRLGASAEQIQEAVREVGNSADDVKKYLAKPHRKDYPLSDD